MNRSPGSEGPGYCNEIKKALRAYRVAPIITFQARRAFLRIAQ